MKLAIKVSELKPELVKSIENLLEKYNFLPYPSNYLQPDVINDWLLIKGMRYDYILDPSSENIVPECIITDFEEKELEVLEVLLVGWKNKNDDILDFFQGNLELNISLTPKHIGEELLKVDLRIPGHMTLARKTGVIVTNSLGQKTLK